MALIARPRAWPAWAPHLRGAWGLSGDDGEVEVGRRGAVRLLGAIPVPATITAKAPGRSWTWRVGVVTMDHAAEPGAPRAGATVSVTMRAPAPVEAALRVTYGPVVARLVRHLARVSRSAAARRRPTGTGSPAG